MHENLSKIMDSHNEREEKKYEFFSFPHDASVSGPLQLLSNLNMGQCLAFLRVKRVVH